ncbi:MAG: hypothetical protein ACREJX_19785, partial [Polyangiaceae bacterium]
MRSFAIAISYVMLAGALACTTTASDDRFVQTSLPDRGSFGPASALLDVRCGSTDCHGNVARNLRLYGSAGLRLSSSDRSLDPLCNTQDE